MTSIEDIYQKFGFASEAAQLLETEVGNILFHSGAVKMNLFEIQDPASAKILYENVNRKTLGQLLKSVKNSNISVDHLEELLSKALVERNRLTHSFYRQHNFRKNSEEGRKIMLDDLEYIHDVLLKAFKAVLLLSGIDLDKERVTQSPTEHVPL